MSHLNSLREQGNVIVSNEEHPLKAEYPILSNSLGNFISLKDVHWENVLSLIYFNSGGNEIESRAVQPENMPALRDLTPLFILTFLRLLQLEKAFGQIDLIEPGIVNSFMSETTLSVFLPSLPI